MDKFFLEARENDIPGNSAEAEAAGGPAGLRARSSDFLAGAAARRWAAAGGGRREGSISSICI